MVINGATIILIYAGALRVNAGRSDPRARRGASQLYVSDLVELVKLANLIITVTKAIACGNRIGAVLKIEPEMKSGTMKWTDGIQADDSGMPAVEFDHVSLRYRTREQTL